MQATIIKIADRHIYAVVRRNRRTEILDGGQDRHPDIKVGDKIEVKRVVNNPYLVRVHA